MREGFEQALQNLNKAAKLAAKEARGADTPAEAEAGPATKEERKALAEVVDAAFANMENPEVLLDLQREKRAVMEALHARLHALDEAGSGEREKDGRSVFYEEGESGGGYYIFSKGGEEKIAITRGEMLTDGMWGASYLMTDSVPRADQKRFYLEAARREVAALLDEQIAHAEGASRLNRGSGRDEAYAAILERGEEGEDFGVVAEKMVKSFLKKLEIDHELPFTVLDVDVYEDVEHKVDFVIRIAAHRRGVGVATGEDIHDIGVQFTTSVSAKTLEKKERQLERAQFNLKHEGTSRLEDIVLVSIPLRQTAAVYEAWKGTKANRRAPGGPDKLWDKKTKEKVFKGVLAGLPLGTNIDKLWDSIARHN
jgi:hypothetical protein